MALYTKDFLRCFGVMFIPSVIALVNDNSPGNVWLIMISACVVNSLIYPFGMRFVRGVYSNASESHYWYIFTFVMSVIFALPLAALYLIKIAFKKGA